MGASSFSQPIIVGGAAKGGDIHGKMPDLTVNGPDDTGRSRWTPTTSVDEYGATTAKWFGVSDTNLRTTFRNIGRFAKPDLGFVWFTFPRRFELRREMANRASRAGGL